MKRILKLLARLYPSGWRNRYGAEYEALLEERAPRTQDIFDVFWGAFKMQATTWSFVRITAATAVAGMLTAVAISFAVQAKYVSRTLISVTEPAPLPKGALDQHLATLVQGVLDQESLALMIQKYNLYPSERARMPMEDVVQVMRKGIQIEPQHTRPSEDGQPMSFFVYFSYPDPHLAQSVDTELVSRFTNANLAEREVQAEGNSQSQSETIQVGETFRVEEQANLPERPSFPKRRLFGLGGLCLGLGGGLLVAAIAGWHRRVTAANG